MVKALIKNFFNANKKTLDFKFEIVLKYEIDS